MSSPRNGSRVEDYLDVTPPVEEVTSRGSNGSIQLQRPLSRESRSVAVVSPTNMIQQCETQHRFSRGTVYPMVTAGLNVRDAFGARSNMMNIEQEGPSPTASGSENDHKDEEFEDTSGGLSGLSQLPEDKDTLPNTETLMFRDGRRRIDMILVYEEEDFGVMTEAEMLRRERRKVFQENLEKEGLELELEDKQMSYDEKTFFLKVHVPWKALIRYAEVMNLKLPTKNGENETGNRETSGRQQPSVLPFGRNQKPDDAEKPRFLFNFHKIFEYNHNRISSEPSFYTHIFSKGQDDRFLVKDREMFYTSAQRSQVVWQVMLRAKYDDSGKIGIRRLLNDKTYLAAFPLHEGKYDTDSASGYIFDRRLLYLEWGRLACWYKKQPLWLIKKYFGDKIGLYFVWLGFYTNMLIPAAIVGFLCFLYGLATMHTDANMPSKEICNMSGPGSIILCPLCDKACNYIKLGDSCLFSKMTYLFDNPATVFFAIFMSFWATSFLELWKRQQAVIVWEWDLQNTEDDEEPRPEFETSVKTFRINPVTREKEPYLSTCSRAWRLLATTSMVLFMVIVVMGAVLGTIIYRISLVTVIHGSRDKFLSKHAKIFTSVTAAVINLVIIMILTNLYKRLAIQLTNLENPRTQTEYEDSYTFKIFVFQFVNFYSSLIYIAFFKGRFFNYPGDEDARQTEFLRIKTDVCDPAGCLSELCIQLAIIMVGKQFFNNFLEVLFPKIRNWWRKRTHRSLTKDLERQYTRWEEDYHLEDAGRMALFEEYLEMVLQYGFVTLFVAAFPLAPLFAFINNVCEIRLDAYKMITQARRPLAERVEDIGAWYGILQSVTYMAVVSNAFVIGYTSDFIPRMVYKVGYSNSSDLVGYIDSSLSDFNISHYTKNMGAEPPKYIGNITTCQYRGYRKGHNLPEGERYQLSPQYWHIFAARLAFVVVFEHIVFALTGIMAYVIPDVPSEVKTQIQREKLLDNEARFEKGLKRQGDDDYTVKGTDALSTIRNSAAAITGRSWWSRRLSKVSDSYDPNSRVRRFSSTVLEEEP